jgi:hypothetical protein
MIGKVPLPPLGRTTGASVSGTLSFAAAALPSTTSWRITRRG